MTINEHLTEFGGYQVVPWEPGDPLGNPNSVIHRIAVEWDDETSWIDKFRAFLDVPGVQATQGLVVGWWGVDDGMEPLDGVAETLVTAHTQLPNVRAMFIADATYEETEISWIENTDLSPVLAAYRNLHHFGVRGGNNLSLGQMDMPELRTLIIQAGGLPAEVVRQVTGASLPNLEHLELYLGTSNYGATSGPEDLEPILDGQLFPKLKYLGLKNSDYQDEIARRAAQAPVLAQLDTLDLSLGVLTDEGAKALLGSEKVKQLKTLDISHNYCSEAVLNQLQALGPNVIAKDSAGQDEKYQYVAIGE